MDLDDAYANAKYIPDADGFITRWEDQARDWREVEYAVGRARLNVPYGDHPRQQLDLFLPAGRPEGLMVFVHGGYWRRFDRKYWSHFAAGAQARGWAVAMPSYRLTPDVQISEITQDAHLAIEHAAELVPGPIVLCGHSAGGHLVARMLCRDVDLSLDVAERLRNVVPISPVSDLRPLVGTEMNADFRLTEAAATTESPALMAKVRDVPVTVWVGADERPVFLEQARWLAEAWGAECIVAPGKHHFDVIDPLADPDSDMIALLLGHIRLP